MINLLPIKEKKRVEKLYVVRFLTVIFVVLSVVALVGYILLIPSYFLTAAKEDLVQKERLILEASQEYVEFESLRDTVRIVNERLNVMDRSGELILHEQLLTKLLLLKTKDITFNSIAYARSGDSQEVELRGAARDRASLVAFIQILEKEEDLDVVEAPVSNYVVSEDLSYVLKLELTMPVVAEEKEDEEL